MALPAGVAPVQSGIALAAPISVPIVVTISPADISNEKTVLLQTPLGPVNATFKKIRDIP
jgi:hypothetical protein